ncbi:hypothetical protein CBS101457_005547 [Exobasidium rhododendri]|nr:hypothetical protein CBS101457_005547 [Exobasidium rhododendri]
MFTNGGPHITRGRGYGAYKQITGCFDARKIATLQANDDGGQVDSNGGEGGRGNPANSACSGYAGYVSLIEPSANRICLRCCKNLLDCDTGRDTSGCPAVIKGNYNGCS